MFHIDIPHLISNKVYRWLDFCNWEQTSNFNHSVYTNGLVFHKYKQVQYHQLRVVDTNCQPLTTFLYCSTSCSNPHTHTSFEFTYWILNASYSLTCTTTTSTLECYFQKVFWIKRMTFVWSELSSRFVNISQWTGSMKRPSMRKYEKSDPCCLTNIFSFKFLTLRNSVLTLYLIYYILSDTYFL